MDTMKIKKQVETKLEWKELVKYLYTLWVNEDRGALAALRKGVNQLPRGTVAMYPIVYPKVFDGVLHGSPDKYSPQFLQRILETALSVSALFALFHEGKQPPEKKTHSGDTDTEAIVPERVRSLGYSFALYVAANPDAADSTEKRFMGLLNAHEDDLHEHLKHAISFLRKDVDVNWIDLAWGIFKWANTDRDVQEKWSLDYWARSFRRVEGGAQDGQDEQEKQNYEEQQTEEDEEE